MRKGMLAAVGSACAIAALAAGCGGGGGESGATITTSSISKSQFIKEVDAICIKGRTQVETAAKTYLSENPSTLKGHSEPDFGELVQTILVPAIEQELDEIRALGAPKGDETKVEALVAAVEEGREKSEEKPKAAAVGGSKAFVKADALAKKYGLAACVAR